MSSQKKSSTKGKGMTPSSPGQRQGTNSKKSRSASGKVNVMSKPIKAPVSRMSQLHSVRPAQSSIDRGIFVKHTELVMTLVKPTTNQNPVEAILYQFARLRVNPGSKTVFNWLSSLAVQYEFYKFRKLKFHFVTRQSTSKSGGIIISPDYDAADGQIPLIEQTIFNNRGTVDGPVWQDITCSLDPASMNRLFKSHVIMSDTRFATTTQDQKTIDPCQVFILTDDNTVGAFVYGKLFVEYEVELTEPQMVTEPTNLGGGVFSANNPSIPQTVLSNNSVRPISSVFTNVNNPTQVNPSLRFDEGLASPVINLDGIGYPTATIARFARDWEGLLQLKGNGSGIASNYRFFKALATANPNDSAGAVGDVELLNTAASIINSSGTSISQTLSGAFKTGEYLKILTPNATTIGQVILNLAGVSLQNIV